MNEAFEKIERNLKSAKRWLIFAAVISGCNVIYASYVIYLILSK